MTSHHRLQQYLIHCRVMVQSMFFLFLFVSKCFHANTEITTNDEYDSSLCQNLDTFTCISNITLKLESSTCNPRVLSESDSSRRNVLNKTRSQSDDVVAEFTWPDTEQRVLNPNRTRQPKKTRPCYNGVCFIISGKLKQHSPHSGLVSLTCAMCGPPFFVMEPKGNIFSLTRILEMMSESERAHLGHAPPGVPPSVSPQKAHFLLHCVMTAVRKFDQIHLGAEHRHTPGWDLTWLDEL